MGFVFVACCESNQRRARAIAAKLAAAGVDICSELEKASDDVRAEAYRAAIDRCALMVALWGEGDPQGAIFVDHMLYAQRSGRLFAVLREGQRLPGNLGGEAGVGAFMADADANALDAVVQSIVARVSTPDEDMADQAPTSAAEEAKAFLRAQRRGSANALARFLREFPGGLFEEVVRQLLDAQTQPDYRAEQSIASGPLNAIARRFRSDAAHPVSQEERQAKDMWLMNASPLQAARDMSLSILHRVQSPLGMTLASVVLAAMLVLAGAQWFHWPQGRHRASVADIAPVDARAVAPSREANPSPSRLSAVSAGAPMARVEEAPATSSFPRTTSAPTTPASDEVASGPNRAVSPAEEPPPEVQAAASGVPGGAALAPPSPGAAQSETSAIELARRQNTVAGYDVYLAAFPSGAFVGEARDARNRLLSGPRAFELAQLEPDARALVQRARASEARANVEAGRARGGLIVARRGLSDGAYRGAVSAGAASGLGRVVWGNGDVYAGAWSASQPNGFGVLREATGARYEGEFVNGAPTGRGVFWNEEGRRLVGDRLFAALVRARTP